MSIVLFGIRLLLAATFTIAGTGKLAKLEEARASMIDFGFPGSIARPLAWIVPLMELSCGVALVPSITACWAAIGVAILLGLFTTGIGINLALRRRPHCNCFGQLYSAPLDWKAIVRNGILFTLAILVVRLGHEYPAASAYSLLSGLKHLSPTTTIAAVISALIIAAVCVRFTSQGQRLSTILRSRNAPNASKSFEPQSGLRIDTAAPDFQAPTLDAGIVTLKALATRHERLLLIFIAPDCKVCCELLPEIAQWQRRVVGLALIPISRGEREATLAKLEQHGVENVLLQRNREISYLYLLRSFPSAVFVKNGRIAASLAIGADAIRALVARSLDI